MNLSDLLLLRELEPPAEPDRGPAGPQGKPGLVWRGPWHRSTDYTTDDAVEHKGSSYIAVAPTTAEPPDGAWDLLAKRGADGTPGANGAIGFRPAATPTVIDGGTP